jgi:hypothetical protein
VLGLVFDLLKKAFRREARSAAFKAGYAFVALLFAAMGVAGLLVSLFFALEPSLGALRSALIVSGVAFALALLASMPLWLPKRRPPPPEPTLAQLLALATGGASGLSARQLAIGAVLVAVVLGVATAKPPAEKK